MDKIINPLVVQFKEEVAKLLVDKLGHLDITIERASEISHYTVQTLPSDLSDEQFHQLLPSLDKKFIELAKLVHKYLLLYEEQLKGKVINETELSLRKKNFDEALDKMKNYFLVKINQKSEG